VFPDIETELGLTITNLVFFDVCLAGLPRHLLVLLTIFLSIRPGLDLQLKELILASLPVHLRGLGVLDGPRDPPHLLLQRLVARSPRFLYLIRDFKNCLLLVDDRGQERPQVPGCSSGRIGRTGLARHRGIDFKYD
jgi:hypothetical protein